MIKIDFKKDIKLILLCLIVICVGIIKYFIPTLNFLQYIILIFHICLILSAKDNELIPILLFNHTCSALYDDIGFQYIFNLTIDIFIFKSIKIIINKKNDKNNIIIFTPLILFLPFFINLNFFRHFFY